MKTRWLGKGICLACLLTAGTCGAELAWHVRTSVTTNELRGITFAYGQFIAVGRLNTMLTSAKGQEWTPRFLDTPDFHSITSGRGWFVTGGSEGWFIGGSQDGIHWTNLISTIGQDRLFGVAFGNGRFVGVGSGFHDVGGIILTATNPLEFDLANSARPTTNALLAVAHGNDLFVAVGERGTIVTSHDGVNNWTARSSGTQETLRAVAFHQSRFVAGGTHGVVLASADGVSWSAAAPVSFDVHGLASSSQELVAVGSYGSAGRLHLSSDGLSWPGTSLEFPQPLRAVVHGPGSFVAVGEGGLIVQSDDLANYWTKPTSGYWEEPYWSLGELPSLQQPAVVMMTPGWKALAVGTTTTANFSHALAIQNLFISAPEGSVNQLLLNYAGLSVPLNIGSDLVLGPNASLASHHSRLNAGRLLLNGPARFSSQSVATLGRIVVGEANSGELSIADAFVRAGAVTVGGGAPGVINQSGGTHEIGAKLSINGQSVYNLTNGSLETGILFLGEEHRPGWTGRLYAWGGSTTVTGHVRLGTSPSFVADARGHFVLLGGSLQTPVMDFGNGVFTQDGGMNRVQSINLPGQDAFGWADYQLGGGTLASELVVIGAKPLGYFVQSGGVHTNTRSIAIYGQSIPEHYPWGTYSLLGGWLSSPQLQVLGGRFTQQNGTNETVELKLDMRTIYTLMGGLLTSSNAYIRSSSARNRQMLSSFVHSNGTHVILNRLYVLDGVYRIEAGTLAASSVHLGPDGELRLNGGSVNVSDTFSMDHGTCLVQGQNYRLGKLLVLSTGALSRFHDGPQVCSFDLKTGPTVLRFLDSHDLAEQWSGFLALTNWSGSTNGGGTDQVFVGTNAQGLAPTQLTRIGFINPEGLPPATYPARILGTGEIVPGPRPTLQVVATEGSLGLTWTGDYQLFFSPTVLGPFYPMFGASSPFTISLDAPQAFYQLRSR
jgi:hypothetical protein